MQRVRRQIDITFSSIFKVVAVAGLLWAAHTLWSLILLFGVAVLLAVTLHPIVRWGERHRMKRGMALGLVTLMVVGAFGLFAGVLLPAIGREVSGVAEDLPQLRQKVDEWAKKAPLLQKVKERVQSSGKESGLAKSLEDPALWGAVAGSALAFPIMLILALYLVADGPRVYAWMLAYIPRRHRPKVGETADGIAQVVYSYVRGQAITSLLVTIFSFVTLSALKVPAPLALAILAGALDIVPFVGFIAFTVPAVLMAFTVSPTAGVIVLVLYVGYHLLETYVIIPKVYGKQMRLSTLTVLIALGVGGALSGVIGAILVLPLVAAYPIIERLWLRPALGDESIEDHVALDQSLEDKDHETVKRVIKGTDHPAGH